MQQRGNYTIFNQINTIDLRELLLWSIGRYVILEKPNEQGLNRALNYKVRISEITKAKAGHSYFNHQLATEVYNDVQSGWGNLGSSKILRKYLLKTLLNFFNIQEQKIHEEWCSSVKEMATAMASAGAGVGTIFIPETKKEVRFRMLKQNIDLMIKPTVLKTNPQRRP